MNLKKSRKNFEPIKKNRICIYFVSLQIVVCIVWRNVLLGDACSMACKQNIMIIMNVSLLIGALIAAKRSNYIYSDCGITQNGILNDFGWGLIAGITYNFLLQGRLVPAVISVGIFFRVLLVAVSEEVVWRGYLLVAIHDITKKKSAAISSNLNQIPITYN